MLGFALVATAQKLQEVKQRFLGPFRNLREDYQLGKPSYENSEYSPFSILWSAKVDESQKYVNYPHQKQGKGMYKILIKSRAKGNV